MPSARVGYGGYLIFIVMVGLALCTVLQQAGFSFRLTADPIARRMELLEAKIEQLEVAVEAKIEQLEVTVKQLEPKGNLQEPKFTIDPILMPADDEYPLSLTKYWRSDRQCGIYAALPDGTAAGCDPESKYPCCSGSWCGITNAHCKCGSCIDYRIAGDVNKRLRLKPQQPHIPGSDGTIWMKGWSGWQNVTNGR